jgi:hypothetical protein
VCDKNFVGDFFTDVITDGLRQSALPSSVIPTSVAISVGKKNHLPMVLQTEFARQKKKIPA